MIRARTRGALLLALTCVLFPAPLGAQATPPGPAAQLADSARSSDASWVRARDVWLGLGLLAGSMALVPADERIATALSDSALQQDGTLHDLGSAFRLYGFPGTVVLAGSVYVLGYVRGSPALAAAGLHGGEAILLAEAVVFTMKGLAGRARPDQQPDDPLDLRLGRGFREGDGFQSFPSGHTAAAFALATALTMESGRHWPRATPWVAPPLYAGATLVALSRMYDGRHWASDVAAGAAVGSAAGLLVVRWHRAHPGRATDAWLLPRVVAPTKQGLLLRWRVDTN